MKSLVLIAFVLIVSLAIAQDAPPALPEGNFDINFIVKNADTSEALKEEIIKLDFSSEGREYRSVQLISSDGIVENSLEAGLWKVHAQINKQETDGNDYFGVGEIAVSKDNNYTIFMMPVGSIAGRVYWEEKTVYGAKIALKCATSFYDMEEIYPSTYSDGHGSFTLNNVPTKNCEIFAQSNGMVGSTKVQLQRGELVDVEINLLQESSNRDDGVFFWVLFFAVIAFVFFTYKRLTERNGKKIVKEKAIHERNIEDLEEGMVVTNKMKAVMQTLNGNERKIVEFLIENKGRSRQSKAYHALLIPKVTLSRAVFSLENKKIISTRKLGKVKELELTEWFLEK